MIFYYKEKFEFMDGFTIEKTFTNTQLINTEYIVHITKDTGNHELRINLVNGEILKIYENYEDVYNNLIKVLVNEKGVTA